MKTNTLAMPPIRFPCALFFALIVICLAFSAQAADGTWTNLVGGNASGSWTNSPNWNNGAIANGTDAMGDFSTLNITTNSTLTLDAPRTIGNLIFGDTTPDSNWVVNATSTNATLPVANAITLATSAGSPIINVTNQTTTFNAGIFGANGFTKTGPGTLRLNNANTNAGGALFGTILVNSGDLQAGNATFGVSGNQNSTNRVFLASGATLEVIPGIGVINKHLTVSGAGVGGTLGAIYANPATNNSSTRWGLSTVNDSGASANSSVSFPAITLAGDTTIRVDGSNFTYVFISGYITGSTNTTVNFTNSFFTLTKTGGGKLSLDRGAMVSNVVVNAGSVAPNSASAFGGVQAWTINSGGMLLNWQNNCYSGASVMTVNTGGIWDINGRNDVAGTGFTETVGTLSGSGTITHGLNMPGISTVSTILAVNSNSVFNGTIQTFNGILNLTKNSASSTLQLNGTNTYNGVTTVSAGILLVDGVHTGASNYVVNAGAVLGGKGTILQNPLNVINLSGSLVAGDNGGTLTVSNVTGGGDVYVTNANLIVLSQLNNSGSGSLNSLNLTNGAITALLQQNGTEASIYANNVNVDGANNILSFTTANPVIGQFPFIKYGTIGGLNGFAGLTFVPPAGMTAFLSNNIANSSIDIVVTAIPALVWKGTPTGDWTNGGPANWLNGATPAAYTETAGLGPFVIFNDTATGTASVNVATNVTPKGITVSSSSKNYTFAGSSAINSSGSIFKDGASTLTFANTASNGLAGTLTINNGALQLGNGGTSGNIGSASVANSGQVVFNRSDDVSFANSISGTGSLVKNNTDTVTLTGVGNIGGSITANAGTLALGPSSTITVSGDVTGNGAFGINGSGRVILSSGNITYSGGSLVTGGTLEFDSAFPPTGNILDNGTLALGSSGTFNNNISGTGGLTLLNGAGVTLGGVNAYAGPTAVLAGGSLTAAAANYSSASTLILGSTNGLPDIGSATFTSGNPVLSGLTAGGNNASGNPITLNGGSQTLTINGNVSVGNIGPSAAQIALPITGTGASVIVNTNGGVIQLGLGATGSGVNPDSVFVDFSGIDNFIANLGTNGTINLGTLDGNPGPPAGATVVNWFNLAGVSNSITAGALNIGAGGRQLIPELRLGTGSNVLNVNTLAVGFGGRDGGYLRFLGGTGGVRVRANDGVSRALLNVGVNPATGTGAGITNTVDLTGHPADLLLSALVIGNYNNSGAYENTFSFDTGILDTLSTSLSVLRNNNANAPVSGSTLNINGGTANLGAVSLTASAAFGTLNISGANVTVADIVSPGSGISTLSLANSTLNLALTNNGNPVTAPIVAQNVSVSGTINLGVNGTNLAVGQFPLVSYIGSIGGDGFPALNLTSLSSGVSGYLSNNIANLSVDLVITNVPATINPNPTNIVFNVSGHQLTLSWPSDHTGWLLQSNSVSLTSTGSWFTLPGSASTNQFIFTVDPTRTNVFFRMLKP